LIVNVAVALTGPAAAFASAQLQRRIPISLLVATTGWNPSAEPGR
jgi:hypothetical protein